MLKLLSVGVKAFSLFLSKNLVRNLLYSSSRKANREKMQQNWTEACLQGRRDVLVTEVGSDLNRCSLKQISAGQELLYEGYVGMCHFRVAFFGEIP